MEYDFIKNLKEIGSNCIFEENVIILQSQMVSIGSNVKFYPGVYVSPCNKDIIIGSYTHFATYSILYGPLEIGNYCAIADHVVFASIGHGYDSVSIPFVKQPSVQKKIIVEDNVWIGANSVIIQGVRIGTGSIIGAGSVVTHDVEPYSVVGGVPARIIKKRK